MIRVETITNQVGAIRNAINDPDNNWFRSSLWEDIDQGVRRTLFNLVINASMIGAPQTIKSNWSKWSYPLGDSNGSDVSVQPALHLGCWAAEYGNKLNLSLEELDSVIQQGKAMGTYFYIYSGGEPWYAKTTSSPYTSDTPTAHFWPLQMQR